MVNETNGVTTQLELLARFWRWLRIVDELVRTLNWRAVIDDAAYCKRQPNSLTRALLAVQSDELGVLTRLSDVIRWDENAGLRRDAIRSQVIDALEAQEIKETGNEED
jgi:hypothetical protein